MSLYKRKASNVGDSQPLSQPTSTSNQIQSGSQSSISNQDVVSTNSNAIRISLNQSQTISNIDPLWDSYLNSQASGRSADLSHRSLSSSQSSSVNSDGRVSTPLSSSLSGASIVSLSSQQNSQQNSQGLSPAPTDNTLPFSNAFKTPASTNSLAYMSIATTADPKLERQKGEKNLIIIHKSQKKNINVLKFLCNSRLLSSEDVLCDYECSPSVGCLFMSLQFYKNTHASAQYINTRFKFMKKTNYVNKILMLLVDIDHPEQLIETLTILAYNNDHTVVCAFSPSEVAKYLELLCQLSHYNANNTTGDKLVNYIQPKLDKDDQVAVIASVLNSVRVLNKTNVKTLLQEFNSFSEICNASAVELGGVKGMGSLKAKKLHDVLHQSFKTDRAYKNTNPLVQKVVASKQTYSEEESQQT